MKKTAILFLLTLTLFSCKEKYEKLTDGLYAEINTNKGIILIQLELDKTPITVANFVSLAEGKNTFVKDSYKSKKFYDNLVFHRVIADFMIQGGDPDGNGSGGTGYTFKDEFCNLKFDKRGILAMANSGPATNSSQFFITHLPTPWLDGKHTIFGKVVENGMDIVNKIQQDDKIIYVKIIRKGEQAKKFDAVKIFNDFFATEIENQKKQAIIDAENAKANEAKYKAIRDNKIAEFTALKLNGVKCPSGLIYKFLTKSGGKKPTKGMQVNVDYAGFLENAQLFDTSIESMALAFGKFDQNRADAKQYIPLDCVAGAWQFIPGFNEGIAKMAFGDKMLMYIPTNLAYGEAGAGNAVPPNANIIFEVELKEKK
jgi:peptidylprolyl isomerase